MALATIHGLKSTSVDFVLAFPQADLDIDIYMEIPAGMEVGDHRRKDYVLKLQKNLYGLKQAGYNWFEHLSKGLIRRGFKQSETDKCVFIGKDSLIIVYVDDCIIFSKNDKRLESVVSSLGEGHENFKYTHEPGISNYLGVQVISNNDGTFELKQPFLIDRILKLVEVTGDFNERISPAIKPQLHKDQDGPKRKCSWNYRQAIGMLNYLQNSTRPDISFAVHQAARFCQDPKLSHERAVRQLA